MSAWDPKLVAQVKLVAKQIAESREGLAWWAFPATIRNTIISHHVLMNVFSQRGPKTIEIDDVRELRILIEQRLDKYHNLKTH